MSYTEVLKGALLTHPDEALEQIRNDYCIHEVIGPLVECAFSNMDGGIGCRVLKSLCENERVSPFDFPDDFIANLLDHLLSSPSSIESKFELGKIFEYVYQRDIHYCLERFHVGIRKPESFSGSIIGLSAMDADEYIFHVVIVEREIAYVKDDKDAMETLRMIIEKKPHYASEYGKIMFLL